MGNIGLFKLFFIGDGFLYDSVLMKNKVSDLQLNQYITANFRRYLNSTTREMHPLCYAKMKARCPTILLSKFEAVTRKSIVLILIYFSF